jgi:hypothetical protein
MSKRPNPTVAKAKGGQEKVRAKQAKLREEDAKKCFSLQALFNKSAPVPAPDSSESDSRDAHAVAAILVQHGAEDVTASASAATERLDDPEPENERNAGAASKNPPGQAASGSADDFTPQPGSHEKTSADRSQSPAAAEEHVTASTCTPSGMFQKPRDSERLGFFRFHPRQPVTDIPFTAQKVYCNDDRPRLWVTYDDTRQLLFCSVCIAYSKEGNMMTKGMCDWRHVYKRLAEHEASKGHLECVQAHLVFEGDATIEVYLGQSGRTVRLKEVQRNREVFKRVVEAVKLIAKCGLSYRGSQNEAAYNLLNDDVNHGNFLEILLFLAKFDLVMCAHIESCARKSAKSHDAGKKTAGGLVTFLSKTTVNTVIDALSKLVKQRIASEVKAAGMYSVQLDTTQDISVADQCSVVIRYVSGDRIRERLVAVVRTTSSTGDAFVRLLLAVLTDLGIDVNRCVGTSTDGAANMQGEYSGFAKRLCEYAPNQVRVWCFAHVLNLVIADCTHSVSVVVTLFGTVNTAASFLKESYQRMDKWQTRGLEPRIDDST